MTMSGKALVKLFQRNGWTIERIEGSHYIMVKGSRTEVIPVHGNRDLKPGLLNAILKRTGLK